VEKEKTIAQCSNFEKLGQPVSWEYCKFRYQYRLCYKYRISAHHHRSLSNLVTRLPLSSIQCNYPIDSMHLGHWTATV